MRIVIDNNIIIDALLERKPFFDLSAQVMTACADANKGYVTANSLTDIFYILKKSIGAARAKLAIRKLMELFVTISINEEDCTNALSLPMNDFEDALVAICAKKVEADYIVTRYDEFLLHNALVPTINPCKTISPGKLMEKLK